MCNVDVQIICNLLFWQIILVQIVPWDEQTVLALIHVSRSSEVIRSIFHGLHTCTITECKNKNNFNSSLQLVI